VGRPSKTTSPRGAGALAMLVPEGRVTVRGGWWRRSEEEVGGGGHDDGHVTLELDLAVAGPLLPLPAPARGDDAEGLLFAEGRDPPRLPPLVVRGIGHVEDLAVAEGEPVRRQPVVLVRVVMEQRPSQNVALALVGAALLLRPPPLAFPRRSSPNSLYNLCYSATQPLIKSHR
jgi:hypothetical protein